MAIGARGPLVAWNLVLDRADLPLARHIARTIRASGGGLPCLKALGLALEHTGQVQVSMNLTDYRTTSMADVFRAVDAEARRAGAAIAGSEIIGLVPRAALDDLAGVRRRWQRHRDQVLEDRLAACGLPAVSPSRTAELHAVTPGGSGSRQAPSSAGLSGRRFAAAPRRRDPERAHLAIQVAALDVEDLGGARDVALLLGQRAQDVVALEALARLVQRQHRPVRAGQLAGADDAVEERQVLDRDGVARHHDQQALDHVAQLAHVARPAVAAQRRQRARIARLRRAGRTRATARP